MNFKEALEKEAERLFPVVDDNDWEAHKTKAYNERQEYKRIGFKACAEWAKDFLAKEFETVLMQRDYLLKDQKEKFEEIEKLKAQLAKEPGLRWVWEAACKKMLQDISLVFLHPDNLKQATLNARAVLRAVGETIKNFPIPHPTGLEEHPDKEPLLNKKEEPLPDEAVGWVSVDIEPEFGGEYNVLYDLEDGGKPMVSTMDYYKEEKKWCDTRGANIVCDTVLMWRELPKPPTI